MKHPIGFCVQPEAPEAEVHAPAAQPEAAAVPSVVRVYFPERDRAYSYYNDRFDLHKGDVVYVSASLRGFWDTWRRWTTTSASGSPIMSA